MNGRDAAYLGIDVGTSGVRAVAIGGDGDVLAQGAARMAEFGPDHRDPDVWWQATRRALARTFKALPQSLIAAVAVDGTSGTLLPVDRDGRPLAQPLMYNDQVGYPAVIEALQGVVPAHSAAQGRTSGLAKAIVLQDAPGTARVIHQADWIAGRLSGRFDVSDENNALKTGYDPVSRKWPDWIGDTAARPELLPDVIAPGTPIGSVTPAARAEFGFRAGTVVVAGTTDGCASFLATGACKSGHGVTALGTTLTVKLMCERPIFAPQFGIYSHRVLGMWLAGGASNTGGNVLAHYFDTEEIEAMSKEIDTSLSSGLDYYPLIAEGERFPVCDPQLKPRLEPRPAARADFLKGMLEGMASVEALGYRRLAELGGPALDSVRTVGGGARNAAWSAIRAARLGVPLAPPASQEAAAGTARLALIGARKAQGA
jgi:sugar (pentulose or hexulose) kinase